MFVTVTGGSGSGKSAFAEDLAGKLDSGRKLYIATMMCFDEESLERVRRHRSMRAGKQFDTLECFTHLEEAVIPQNSTVLLECMSNLAANEFFSPEGRGEQAEDAIRKGLDRLKERAGNVCVVTNEIFSDGIWYDSETMRYIKLLGQINRYLAKISDCLYEVVYGIPVCLKGEGLL